MKNFTQKFIGIFALVFAMSYNINAQQEGRSNGEFLTMNDGYGEDGMVQH